MSDYKVLGKNHVRVDALDKVTGHATYAGDVYLPEMLVCKVLTSSRSHARIVSIDTSEAAALPGVRGIITGRDFPDVYFGSGALRDRRVMARDEVFYIGEPVAAVAADDEITAMEALSLIKVEYENLDSVVDPVASLTKNTSLVHPDLEDFEGYGFALGGNNCTMLDADRGDVDVAFAEADHIIEETYHTQAINQGFLEPMACVANLEANGRLTVWASTQGPYQVRQQLASVLDMPIGNIKIVAMEMGGGFGAKLRLALEAFPALLSMKTNRPVKLVNTREETFTLNGPRLETNIYLKTAVTNDGRITAREARSVFDVGAYLGAGPNSGVGHGLGAYNIPNFRLRSYGVYTNKIYVGSYRASGVADMTFAVESHMDVIAHRLGLDPLEFRRLNALQEGDVGVSGARIPRHGLAEVMDALKEKMALPSSSRGAGNGADFDGGQRSHGPRHRHRRRRVAQRQWALHRLHQRQRGRHGGSAHRICGHFGKRHITGTDRSRGAGPRDGTGDRRQARYRSRALHRPQRRQPHRLQPGQGGANGSRGCPRQADCPGGRPPWGTTRCHGVRGWGSLRYG